MTIGVLTHPSPDLSSPYFSECLAGLGSVFSPAEWVVNPSIPTISSFRQVSSRNPLQNPLGNDKNGVVEISGWILLGPSETDLDKVRRTGRPAVVVNGDDGVFPSVDLDNVGAARQVMDHMIRLGHRRIGFIAGKSETANARHREQGYREALAAAALPFDPALVEEGRFAREGGRRAMEKFLGLSVPPTAVFAANDHMALGAWDVLMEKGKGTPYSIDLAGFDDIPEAAEAKLTSVRQPLSEMTSLAAHWLIEWVHSGRSPHPRTRKFHGKLILR